MKLVLIHAAAKRIARSTQYLRSRDFQLTELGILLRTADETATRLYDVEHLEQWFAEISKIAA